MALIRNTFWSGVAAIALSGGRFLLAIFLAKKLGVEEYGSFVYSQWIVDTTCLVCALGLPGLGSRFFAEFGNQTNGFMQQFQRLYFLYGLLAICLAFGGALIAVKLFDSMKTMDAILLSLWAAVSMAWTLTVSRAQGTQMFKKIAASNLVYVALITVGCIFFLRVDFKVDIRSIVALMAGATLIAAFVAWTPSQNLIKCNQLSDLNFGSLRSYAIAIWATSLVGALVWSRGEIIIIRSELDFSQLAIYSSAISLTGIGVQGLMLLTGALAPHMTSLWGAGKINEAITLCCKLTDILTLVASILVLFIINFSPEIIKYTFGSEYESASNILAIASFGVLGLAGAASVNQLVSIKSNGRFGLLINCLGAGILFLVGLPLVKFFGVYGAALIRIIIQNGIGVLTLYYAKKFISKKSVNIKNQYKSYLILILNLYLIFYFDLNIYLRSISFLMGGLIFLYWCKNQNGEYIFLELINEIAGIITTKFNNKGKR